MDELLDMIQECIDAEQDQIEVKLGDQPPEGLVNRETGLPPTNDEWQAVKAHAASILSNPYASPESVTWALDICPDGIAVPFDRAIEKLRRKAVLATGAA